MTEGHTLIPMLHPSKYTATKCAIFVTDSCYTYPAMSVLINKADPLFSVRLNAMA